MDRDDVKQICLALQSVTLDHPWDDGHDAYRIGGKMFALVGSQGGLMFKVSEIAFAALIELDKARPAPYLARSKWVQIDLPTDWVREELAAHLEIAHRMIGSKLTKKAQRELGLI